MGQAQTTDRSRGEEAIAEVIRNKGRRHRVDQARAALLYFDTYRWEKSRIMEALDIDARALDGLLAADGVMRCTECAFEIHRGCTEGIDFGVDGRTIPCECSCRSGVSRLTDSRCHPIT